MLGSSWLIWHPYCYGCWHFMTVINVIEWHKMSFYDIYDGHKMSQSIAIWVSNLPAWSQHLKYQMIFIVISKKENKKSKLIFFRFSLYNPLYIFKIPEKPKDGGVGLWNFWCMLILIHIMGKHHVHFDFSKKVGFFLTRPIGDWGLGLGIGIGFVNWRLRLVIGIWDWDWRLGLGIGYWGLGLGIGIGDWEWEFRFGIGIGHLV